MRTNRGTNTKKILMSPSLYAESKDSKACQEKDLIIKNLSGADDDDDDNMFQDCIDWWKEKEKKIDEMTKQLKESEKKYKSEVRF